MLYSHPKVLGTMADEVFSRIKGEIDKINAWNTTLSEFTNWWKFRDDVNFNANYDQKKKTILVSGKQNEETEIRLITDIQGITTVY